MERGAARDDVRGEKGGGAAPLPCAGLRTPAPLCGPVYRSHCPLRQWGALPRARPADSPEKEMGEGLARGAGSAASPLVGATLDSGWQGEVGGGEGGRGIK